MRHIGILSPAWLGPAATAIALILGATGCGSQSDRLKARLASLETQLTSVTADQDRLEDRLEAMEVTAAMSARMASSAADSPERVERPRLKVIRVSPDETASDGTDGHAPAVPESAEPEPQDPRPVIRGQGERIIKTGDGDTTSKATPRERYEGALRLLRGGDYDRAMAELENFVKLYPRDPYTDNALYWMGECHYAKADYNRALELFSDVVRFHPHGNKVPDALLKKGMVLKRLGKASEAERLFAVLTEQFPSTEAARRIPRGN